MKKLLMLMLILGMASAANAALSLELVGSPLVDGAVTWDVSGMQITGTGSGPTAGKWDGSLGPPTGSAILAAADTDVGAGAGYTVASGIGSCTVIYNTAAVSSQSLGATVQTAGVWFVLDVSGMSLNDTSTLDAYNASNGWQTPIGSMTIKAVPEPMTIALLGLGGLFLRRRK
jgi:hypothetical protein